MRARAGFGVVAVLLVAVGVYGRSLGFPYFLDAFDILAEPVTLHSAFNITRFPHYIRPLWMAAVWLGRGLTGADPLGQHLVALALHLANTVMVYAVVTVLFGGRVRASLAALTWTLFGWNAYNVAHAMVVPPLLLTGFLLACLLLFWRGLAGNAVARALAPIAYAAGLLSKESALPFIGILFLAAWFVRGLPVRKALACLAPFAAVLVVYGAARVAHLGAASVQILVGGVVFPLTPRALPALAPAMVLHYLRQLAFLPFPIPMLPLDWLGAAHAVLSAALVLALLWLWRTPGLRTEPDGRMLRFGAGWCLIQTLTFVLTSHPRLLYPIGVGFAFMLAALGRAALAALPTRKAWATAVLLVLAAYGASHAMIGWRIQDRLAGDSTAVLTYYAAEYLRPGLNFPTDRSDAFRVALRSHVSEHLSRHGCLGDDGIAPACIGDLSFDLNDLLVRWGWGNRIRERFLEGNR